MIHIFLLQSKNSYQHKNVYFKVAYLTSGLLMLAQHNHLVLLLLLLDHFVLLARLLQDRLLMHIHLSRLLFERAHQLLLVDQTQLPLYALLVESLHLFGAIAVLSVPVPEQRLLQLGAEAAALEALDVSEEHVWPIVGRLVAAGIARGVRLGAEGCLAVKSVHA